MYRVKFESEKSECTNDMPLSVPCVYKIVNQFSKKTRVFKWLGNGWATRHKKTAKN